MIVGDDGAADGLLVLLAMPRKSPDRMCSIYWASSTDSRLAGPRAQCLGAAGTSASQTGWQSPLNRLGIEHRGIAFLLVLLGCRSALR